MQRIPIKKSLQPIRKVDRDGYFLSEDRFREIHDGHKLRFSRQKKRTSLGTIKPVKCRTCRIEEDVLVFKRQRRKFR